MMGGKGFYRGSSVLSGTSGTGKTSVAAHFVDAACRRGERCHVRSRNHPGRSSAICARSASIWSHGSAKEPAIPCGTLQGENKIPARDPQTHLQLPAQHRGGGPDYLVSTLNEVRCMLARLVPFS